MTTREFWEEKHQRSDTYWLTGSTLHQLNGLYELEGVGGERATEIGVGIGSCTRGLRDAGYKVSAVDVSPTALARVSEFAETYEVADLEKAPPADLAICHLVFQHIDTRMIQHILENTRLKTHGVFAFQTAWMDRPAVGLKDDMVGLHWHTGGEVLRFANAAGLEVYWQRRHRFHIKGDVVWWSLFKAHAGPSHRPGT